MKKIKTYKIMAMISALVLTLLLMACGGSNKPENMLIGNWLSNYNDIAIFEEDGITDVTVQPTHVINGIENDLMKEDVLAFSDSFSRITFGVPLLTSEQDSREVVKVLTDAFGGIPKDEALVFMGHGTPHYANAIYAALDYTFKDLGYHNLFMGTVEAYPSMDSLLRLVGSLNPSRVHLAPFMIVAGDHARNDLAGDDADSWKSQFEQAGYPVLCHLKGLGEYEGIRQIFLRHIREAQ